MSTPIALGPYTEGVNLVDPLTMLSPNELSVCKNINIGVAGDFYKRLGHQYYGNNSGASGKANGDALVNLATRYYKSDGTKKLIVAAGGKLRVGTDAGGTWTDISINGTGASMHATNLVDWMVYKDRLYLTDGTQPQRYNTVDDINAGHVIPAAPTLVANTSGILPNGTYKYMVTSVTSDMGEGPAGATATITLSGSNDGVSLSNILDAAAKHNEVSKKIYRTKVGGTLFYFLAEILVGTTTYSDITIADSALGEEYIPTHIPRADSRFVIMGHDDRAYWFGRAGVNASVVEVSDVGFPDRILNTEFFAVANNDGDILTGGGLVPGGIIFFKRNSMWLSRAFGYGLINISPREKRGGGVGTISPFSIVSTPIGLIFLSQRGEIYLFDGTNIEEIGRKISSEFKGLTTEASARVVACYHDYRYQISYDWRGSKGYNTRTLKYDIRTRRWEGPDENGDLYTPSYYSVWDSSLDSGELVWGEAKAASGSRVYVRNQFTKTDRGTKFRSEISSGKLPLARLGEVKSYKIFVHGQVTSDVKLTASHLNEQSVLDSVDLTTPVVFIASQLNGTDNLGPNAPVIKLGGAYETVLEGSFSPNARSRTPKFSITDNGTAVDIAMNLIQVLVEPLPLK